MGKLYDRLQLQLKTEHKEDAKECLKIYDKLREMYGGCVWESNWNPLVSVEFIGNYPYKRRYYPTSIGKIFLDEFSAMIKPKTITYTEEEVENLIEIIREPFNYNIRQSIKLIFEQNKKK